MSFRITAKFRAIPETLLFKDISGLKYTMFYSCAFLITLQLIMLYDREQEKIY